MDDLLIVEGLAGGVNDYLGKNSVTIEERRKNETLEKYRSLLKSKESFVETFYVNYKETLSKEENSVRIICPATKSSDGEARKWRLQVDRPYTCQVVSIDEGDGTSMPIVTVKRAWGGYDDGRSKIIATIDKALGDKVNAKVRVRVEGIDFKHKRIIVDVGGAKIPGYIEFRDWTSEKVDFGFIRSVAERGTIEYVRLIKKVDDGDEIFYQCSRKACVTSVAWKDIAQRYPKGATVNVECVSIPNVENPKAWFGKIEGLKDIMVYGHFPKRNANGTLVQVQEGGKYRCYITHSGENTKDSSKGGSLRVNVVAVV